MITKTRAQDLVLAAAENGLDAVVVNPTFMLGPYDAKPSSGGMIVELVRGRMPFYTLGTNNFVDVRDVARGMVLAAERGKSGELYILGGINMTYRAAMELICDTAGVRAPRFKAPKPVAKLLALGGDLYAQVTGNEPQLTSSVVAWSQCDCYLFRHDKAAAELGYETSPLPPAIEDAIAWFRAEGGYL